MKDGFFLKTNLVNQTDFCAFWCGIYDSKLIRRFVKLFEHDWVVLDVGANIGYYTIPFSLFGNCKVYAFEPLASNYSHLQQAIEKNNCKNVVPVNIGLGDENGKYIISETERGGTGNAVITGIYDGENSKRFVEISRLDDFYEDHDIMRCDFIKLDIEGFEIAFLRGATEVIRKHRPIVFGEFNSYWLKANNHSFEEAWNLFKYLGYGIYQLKPSGSFVEVKTLGQNMENILFVPSEYSKKDWESIVC